MSSIEYEWKTLKLFFRTHTLPLTNLREFEVVLQYDNIPEESIQNVISGMSRRMPSVITGRGRNNRYCYLDYNNYSMFFSKVVVFFFFLT